MKIGTGAGAAMVLLAIAAPCAAQSPTDKAGAETLFDEARRLLAQNKLGEACPKFAESQRLDPAIGTQLNLGDCYERAGKLASAWAQFREAAAVARNARDPNREAEATRRAAALEPRLAKLTVAVPAGSQVAGLQVKRDGAPVGAAAWGSSAPVDPGEHRIEASAPGKRGWSKVVVVDRSATVLLVSIPRLEDDPAAGAAATAATPATAPVVVATPTDAAGAPRGDESTSGRGNTQRIFGIVVGSVGLVGVGVGAVFGLQASSKKSDSNDHCHGDLCDAKGVTLRSDALHAATVSTIGFAGGAAALLGGTLLYVTAPSGKSTAVRVHATPSTAGLAVTRTW